MQVTVGENGLTKSWQADFEKTTKCCRCGGEARIGFVAHEGMEGKEGTYLTGNLKDAVCNLHTNNGKGEYWLHDYCAVAVYFCKECLETTALYNQG